VTIRRRRAAILIIGNEILSGKIRDENSPYLARELASLGARVERIVTVPDEVEVIAHHVADLAARFDVVLTSGGVGPTHDDKTFEAIAAAFGLELELSQELLGFIERVGRRPATPEQQRMARIPKGSAFADPGGLWPTILVRNVYVFPGVPAILRQKFEALRERFRGPPRALTTVYLDRDEWTIVARIDATVAAHPDVEVGSYPVMGEHYRTRLTFEADDPEHVRAAVADLLARFSAAEIVRVAEG